MKILQLAYRVPFPPNDGGAIGIYNILKGYADAGHEVHLLAINTPKHFQENDVLSHLCKQTNVFVNTNINPIQLLLNLLTDKPYNVARFISADVEKELVKLIQNNNFDIIHVDGIFMAHYIDSIRQNTQCPVIVRAHNIEYVIWERLAAGATNWLKKKYFSIIAKRLKKFETIYYNKFDAIAAITPRDAARLQELGVTKPVIDIIPAGVILDKFQFQPTNRPKPTTIFNISALDWMPNLEALEWFLTQVWPQLSLQVPDLEFHIAGKSMPKILVELNTPNIIIHGMVPSAVDFINAYDIMVVPLLSGGGMRVKIIEAMALGKCIISSPVGAEGIAYTDKKNIFICNTPDEWVKTIINCLENPINKASVAEEALLLAQKHYDNRKVTAQYVALFNQLLTK